MDDETKTIKFYDDNAEAWASKRLGGFWINRIKKFKEYLPSGKIFEVGSGPGIEARYLADLGYDYIGTDISEGLLKIARKNNPDLKFEKQNVYDLDFKGELFNGFWAAAVLLHIPRHRINLALFAISKNLHVGAIGFVSVKKGDGERIVKDERGERMYVYWQDKEFRQELARVGFEILEFYEKTREDDAIFLVYYVKKIK